MARFVVASVLARAHHQNDLCVGWKKQRENMLDVAVLLWDFASVHTRSSPTT